MTAFHIACLKRSKELIACFTESERKIDLNKTGGDCRVKIN